MGQLNHRIDKCKHGIVVTQCRCMKPDKEVRIVPCPSRCKEKEEL